MTRVIDVTGRTFDRLTVVGQAATRVTPSGQRKTYWSCVCSCGEQVDVESQNLRAGRVRSCGCLSREVAYGRHDDGMAGSRFGRLVVVERIGTSCGAVTWRCVCDCGTERVVRGFALRRGMTQSCGCLALERATAAKIRPVVKYLSAHDRITGQRGRAATHRCVDCEKQAHEWSYDGGDPDELTELVHGKWLLAYSLNVTRYSPRCRSCHRKYDHAQRVAS